MLFVLLIFVEFVESAVKGVGPTFVIEQNENEIVPEHGFICPADISLAALPLFSLSCKTDEDCKLFGDQCCRVGAKKICRQGTAHPIQEPKHKPLLPGIPRRCPTKEAIIEFLPVQNCTKDTDCGTRICCPDGGVSYCRTAVPKWDTTLSPRLVKKSPLVQSSPGVRLVRFYHPLKNMVSYLQCTTPPPPFLDLFPKFCKSTLDCFPNLCCQERGRKVCRPPKRSVLRLLAAFAQGDINFKTY